MAAARRKVADRFTERNARHMYSNDLRAFEQVYIKNLEPTHNVPLQRRGGGDVKAGLLINQTYNMHCSAIPLGSVGVNNSGISLPTLQRYNQRQRVRGRGTGRSTGRRRERCPFANDADTRTAAASPCPSQTH